MPGICTQDNSLTVFFLYKFMSFFKTASGKFVMSLALEETEFFFNPKLWRHNHDNMLHSSYFDIFLKNPLSIAKL